jgi:hypothetical protein
MWNDVELLEEARIIKLAPEFDHLSSMVAHTIHTRDACRFPMGRCPMNGPVCVLRYETKATTQSASATIRSTVNVVSGKARAKLAINC